MTATAQANPEILLEKELRTRIKQDLPKSVFARRPSRALWYLPNLAIIIVGTWAILSFDLAWHFKLALALIVGHTYGTHGFLAHYPEINSQVFGLYRIHGNGRSSCINQERDRQTINAANRCVHSSRIG